MGASSSDSCVHFVPEWVVHEANYGFLADGKREGDGGIREAVDEVQGSVDRITHKGRGRREGLANFESLLAQEENIGEMG